MRSPTLASIAGPPAARNSTPAGGRALAAGQPSTVCLEPLDELARVAQADHVAAVDHVGLDARGARARRGAGSRPETGDRRGRRGPGSGRRARPSSGQGWCMGVIDCCGSPRANASVDDGVRHVVEVDRPGRPRASVSVRPIDARYARCASPLPTSAHQSLPVSPGSGIIALRRTRRSTGTPLADERRGEAGERLRDEHDVASIADRRHDRIGVLVPARAVVAGRERRPATAIVAPRLELARRRGATARRRRRRRGSGRRSPRSPAYPPTVPVTSSPAGS